MWLDEVRNCDVYWLKVKIIFVVTLFFTAVNINLSDLHGKLGLNLTLSEWISLVSSENKIKISSLSIKNFFSFIQSYLTKNPHTALFCVKLDG